MTNREALFERYSIPKAIMTLATPTILGMLITVIYNMADTYFVGQTGNTNMVAAVSLCLPVFYLLMAVGNIFGIGGGTYISRLLGQKDHARVKRVSAFSFYTCIAVGLLCIAVFLSLMGPLLRLAGAKTAETFRYGADYLTIIGAGAPLVALQYSMGQMIRAEGATRISMTGMAIGSVVNIALDPLMISGFGWGTAGAALATIIGNASTVVFYIIYITRRRSSTVLSIHPKNYRPDKKLIAGVLKIGIPSSLNTVLICVANTFMNNFASSYSDAVLASVGVAFRVAQVPRLLLIGLAQGTQPFVGYNFAARNYKRMNGAIRFSGLVGVAFGSAACAVILSFSGSLVKLFIADPDVILYGSLFLRIYVSALPVLILLFLFMFTFQALGKAVPAMILSVFRDGVAYIPALFALDALIGAEGIAWAQPLSDGLTIALAAIFYLTIYTRLKKSMGLTDSPQKPYTQSSDLPDTSGT